MKHEKPETQQFLIQLLEEPRLVRIIQTMDDRLLGKLINHIGLEDTGEIVALATTEQLKNVFDVDLWKSTNPGAEETFDADRFMLWLEILHEVSPSFAAEKLIKLDEDFLTLAFCKHIFVLDLESLIMRMSMTSRDVEDNLADKVLESSLAMEWDNFHIISKNSLSWDAIISVFTEIDKNNHAILSELLERICHISTEVIEDSGGLYQILTSEEMLETDLSAEREYRREKKGYVAPSAAVSFLDMINRADLKTIETSETEDYITRSYFDNFAHLASSHQAKTANTDNATPPQQQFADFYEKLKAADILPKKETPQLLEANTNLDEDLLISRILREVREQHEEKYNQALLELNYLANVLISGYPQKSRRLRPIEAAEKVLHLCNTGFIYMLMKKEIKLSETEAMTSLFNDYSLVKLFKISWKKENYTINDNQIQIHS